PAASVDEQCHGHLGEMILPGKGLVHDHDWITHGNVAAGFSSDTLREERPHGFPPIVIHGHAHDRETLVSIFLIELHVPGNFEFAASAPGSPEVEQDYF